MACKNEIMNDVIGGSRASYPRSCPTCGFGEFCRFGVKPSDPKHHLAPCFKKTSPSTPAGETKFSKLTSAELESLEADALRVMYMSGSSSQWLEHHKMLKATMKWLHKMRKLAPNPNNLPGCVWESGFNHYGNKDDHQNRNV